MSALPLTDVERTDARRFAGYPAYGTGPSDASFMRYNPRYELLEYRLSNATDAELGVIRVKLSELNLLDTAIAGASSNLDTDQAAVWHHNKDEVRDRQSLFTLRRRELCGFLGIPPGPALGGAGGGSITLVV